MENDPETIAVIATLQSASIRQVSLPCKILTSSLTRSLFTGRIAIFSNNEASLFRVERRQVEEITVPHSFPDQGEEVQRRENRRFVFSLGRYIAPKPRQWVLVADAGTIAIRNIDHLLPPDLPGPHAPPEVDFYWAPMSNGKNQVSTGLWAVRGEHFPLVLERWKRVWEEGQHEDGLSEVHAWTRVVEALPLRKRRFERGEVVAPEMGAVDWETVTNAALVTVPDWPEKEAWRFLQALYFGTYLGDETGMMLNILEA
jgi:hypothetical protein